MQLLKEHHGACTGGCHAAPGVRAAVRDRGPALRGGPRAGGALSAAPATAAAAAGRMQYNLQSGSLSGCETRFREGAPALAFPPVALAAAAAAVAGGPAIIILTVANCVSQPVPHMAPTSRLARRVPFLATDHVWLASTIHTPSAATNWHTLQIGVRKALPLAQFLLPGDAEKVKLPPA